MPRLSRSAASRRGRRGAARDRDRGCARPARGRGPAARSAARPGHRGAGRAGPVRARRADQEADDRPPPRRRPARAGPARRGAARARSRRRGGGHRGLRALFRAGQPGRGTWPGAGACAGASGPPATACSTIRSPMPSRACAGSAGPTSELDALIGRLAIGPVLTAHPTEARRRTALVALGRCAVLLARLDDPRLTPSEDREVRRRLREEITLLWRTSDLRLVRPTPLDEVRTAMAFFDATLFTVIPRLYRALDAALDPPAGRADGPAADTGRTGTRPPRVGPFLQPGSWIGGDRDGNPGVTAEITARTLRIHADHVLRGYEAVATRLMQTIAAATPADRVARPLASRLARDAEDLPGDRPPAPPALPGRAVPPALRLHRRAAAPDAGRARRRARAVDRAATARRRSSTRSSPSSRTRSWPTAWGASRGARWPSCAGRSARSGSTSPRSRSASTRRSTPRRWPRSGPGHRPRPRCRRASRSTRSSARSGRSPPPRRGSASTPAIAMSSASPRRRRT